MQQTIYVITHLAFNHSSSRPGPSRPLDPRFLNGKKNYVYYLIDKEIPPILQNKSVILEHELDQDLYRAGGEQLGEWSFLLAEEKYAFCQYPFFMISSRFYEKNHWLYRNLDEEWDELFSYFEDYGWGYLPSYDRPLRWINLSWEKDWKNQAWRYKFFPMTDKAYHLIEEVFGIKIPDDYPFTADLFCNYIGFRSRQELLEYTAFYRKIIDYFFDEKYQLKVDISIYFRKTGIFRNEKSFTFLLELLCHLFFFQKKKKYFALHYRGYYSLDESNKKMTRLKSFPVPFYFRNKRLLGWHWRRLKTEGCLSPARSLVNNLKKRFA